jgi:hypothetical protein
MKPQFRSPLVLIHPARPALGVDLYGHSLTTGIQRKLREIVKVGLCVALVWTVAAIALVAFLYAEASFESAAHTVTSAKARSSG